jgi:hypothetical protein
LIDEQLKADGGGGCDDDGDEEAQPGARQEGEEDEEEEERRSVDGVLHSQQQRVGAGSDGHGGVGGADRREVSGVRSEVE